MSRKGIPNKPKEVLSPELAKLAQVTMDPNIDEETRQAAAEALAQAIEPPPAEPSTSGRKMQYIAMWNKWECACDWFSAAGMCQWCREEYAAQQAARKAAAASVADVVAEILDLDDFTELE
jgi:hypothetical protein